MAKGVFPEDHPMFAGVLDMACNQMLWQLLEESDLIIAAGFDAVELIKPWRIAAPVLHIDALQNTDQIYASDVECVGDVGAVLDWLSASRGPDSRDGPRRTLPHTAPGCENAYYAGRVDGHLNPTDVVDVVRAAMPRDTIATTDVGSHKLLVGQGWRTHAPRGLLMTNGLSSMGFGVPAAIAAKLAFPSQPVVALVGDGGFAMAATEIRLAAARGLPIVFVVFVDGSLNRIELKQMAQELPEHGDQDRGHRPRRRWPTAMDCDGVRAESTAELEKALTEVESLRRPLVVEARIDPSQYESQF